MHSYLHLYIDVYAFVSTFIINLYLYLISYDHIFIILTIYIFMHLIIMHVPLICLRRLQSSLERKDNFAISGPGCLLMGNYRENHQLFRLASHKKNRNWY